MSKLVTTLLAIGTDVGFTLPVWQASHVIVCHSSFKKAAVYKTWIIDFNWFSATYQRIQLVPLRHVTVCHFQLVVNLSFIPH